jgi:hypothetical protein
LSSVEQRSTGPGAEDRAHGVGRLPFQPPVQLRLLAVIFGFGFLEIQVRLVAEIGLNLRLSAGDIPDAEVVQLSL